MAGLLAWFKTRAGMVNLSLYLIIGIVAYLGIMSWIKTIEEKALTEEANKALTNQLTEVAGQLEQERATVARLKDAKEAVSKVRVDSEKQLEENRDETGAISVSAVAAVLCSRGLAEPEACRPYTDEPD